MIEPQLVLQTDHGGAVNSICKELQLPVEEVAQVYTREFERLEKQARIRTFLTVLAVHNTKLILRELSRCVSLRSDHVLESSRPEHVLKTAAVTHSNNHFRVEHERNRNAAFPAAQRFYMAFKLLVHRHG